MTEKFKQAYHQKPWRIQLRWIGLVVLLVVMAVLAGILNLNILTRSADAGVQIRLLEGEREKLERDITANRTKLALLVSANSMQARAKELGFVQAARADIQYLYLDEYMEKVSGPVSIPPSTKEPDRNPIKPAYLHSVWDWLFEGTFTLLDREGK